MQNSTVTRNNLHNFGAFFLFIGEISSSENLHCRGDKYASSYFYTVTCVSDPNRRRFRPTAGSINPHRHLPILRQFSRFTLRQLPPPSGANSWAAPPDRTAGQNRAAALHRTPTDLLSRCAKLGRRNKRRDSETEKEINGDIANLMSAGRYRLQGGV